MKVLILISFITLLSSCKKAEDRSCFKSVGKITNKEIQLNSAITHFEFNDDVNINLVEDSISFIQLTGPKNLLKFIDFRQENNALIIYNGNKCDFLRNKKTISVEIHTTSFHLLKLRGYGLIRNNDSLHSSIEIDAQNSFSKVNLNFDCDSVIYKAQGGAVQSILKGTCNNLYAYSISNAIFNSSELKTSTLHFNNSGISTMQGWCDQNAIVEINNQGNVILSGNPSNLLETGSGSGKITTP